MSDTRIPASSNATGTDLIRTTLGSRDADLLRRTLVEAEDWLMNRVLAYALETGYTRYTSTLVEAWRLSVEGLTGSILAALDLSSTVPTLDVELDPVSDPLAAFGIEEADRHRRRGVNLAMFLGLFKYYRLSYHDALAAAHFDDPQAVHFYVDTVFDRTELGYTATWAGTSAETQLRELSAVNRNAINEKTRMLTLIEGLPLPALLVSEEGSVELHNRLASSLFGRSSVPGTAYYGRDPLPDQVGTWVDDLTAESRARSMHSDGGTVTREIELATSDGPRTFVAYVDRLRDVSRKTAGFAIALLDVTQAREHERSLAAAQRMRDEVTRRLAEQERLFRLTFDSSPVGMVLIAAGTDVAARHVRVNPSLLETLGYRQDELLALPHSALLHPDDIAASAAAIDAAIAGVTHPLPTPLRYLSRDGREVSTMVYTVGVRGDDGSVDHVLRQVEDQSERQQVEFELRRSQKLEAVGALASGIAHEINTPIQFISDNMTFLERASAVLVAAAATGAEDPLPAEDAAFYAEEIPAAIQQSREGLERVSAIVAAMRMFGHPDSDTPQPADVAELVTSCVTMARHEITSVTDVDVDLADGIPLISCFPGELRQALLNLVVNAAHAVAERDDVRAGGRGTIVIRARDDGQWLSLSVSDDGVGIPASLQERVFEPFFTTKEPGRGTGQGLAQVHSVVVDRHGGRVRLTSAPGVGTTVLLLIPHRPVG